MAVNRCTKYNGCMIPKAELNEKVSTKKQSKLGAEAKRKLEEAEARFARLDDAFRMSIPAYRKLSPKVPLWPQCRGIWQQSSKPPAEKLPMRRSPRRGTCSNTRPKPTQRTRRNMPPGLNKPKKSERATESFFGAPPSSRG